MADTDLKLPDDLRAFLQKGLKLQYDAAACECGRVSLLPLGSLKAERIEIITADTPNEGADPHADEDGRYVAHAVNLIAEAGGYDPEFVLCWLPDVLCFATLDTDHGVLFTFPGVTWTDIAKNPAPYINAQWCLKEGGRPGVCPEPWKLFPFELFE